MKLENRVFAKIFRENTRLPENEIIEKCIEHLETINLRYKCHDFARLNSSLQRLLKSFKRDWKAARYDWQRFQKAREEWLKSTFDFNFERGQRNIQKRGRKELPFKLKSIRRKQDAVLRICASAKHDVDLLLKSALRSGTVQKNKDLMASLKTLIENGYKHSDNSSKMSPKEGVALLIDADLSQNQYHMIRMRTLKCGVDLIPPYKIIQKEKKKCVPEGVVVSAFKASVSLQKLQDHTSSRIIELIEPNIESYMSEKNMQSIDITMTSKYGFDGSSGQSQFNQELCNSVFDDSNIFAVTFTPLTLTASEHVVWQNSCPSSVRFCRPISLEFIKETKEVNTKTKQDLDNQIADLETFTIILRSGKSVSVSYELHLTMVDGKVVSHITNTSSFQRCNCCSATPKQMNDLKNISNGTFAAEQASLIYGISCLHCWIRVFEALLHISYRIPIKKWQVRTITDKEIVKQRKLEVQTRFATEFNMRVDMPTPGGSGNSNTGNVARRAFSNEELLSSVLNIDVKLIRKLHVILIAISCDKHLDYSKFKQYCIETAELYVQLYEWYPMPASLHRILIHAADIALNSPLPLGMMSEEAAEARNKYYKSDRINHARKNSRENNMSDLFTRQLISSDPIISAHDIERRLKSLKKKILPGEVRELLADDVNDANNNHDNSIIVQDLELEIFPLLDEFVLESAPEET